MIRVADALEAKVVDKALLLHSLNPLGNRSLGVRVAGDFSDRNCESVAIRTPQSLINSKDKVRILNQNNTPEQTMLDTYQRRPDKLEVSHFDPRKLLLFVAVGCEQLFWVDALHDHVLEGDRSLVLDSSVRECRQRALEVTRELLKARKVLRVGLKNESR